MNFFFQSTQKLKICNPPLDVQIIIEMHTWNVETEVIFLLLLLIETSVLSTSLDEEIFLTLLISFLGMNS